MSGGAESDISFRIVGDRFSSNDGGTPFEERSEKKRQRLWEGPRSASTRKGFFEGPLPLASLEPPGSEFSLNLKFWRRFFRLLFIGIRDPWTFALFAVVLGAVFASTLIGPHLLSTTGGFISSTTVSYVSLFRPGSPVIEAINRWPSPENETLQAFARDAVNSAISNLWLGGNFTGVCTPNDKMTDEERESCTIMPPPAWRKVGAALKYPLPETLWLGLQPAGNIKSLGVIRSFASWYVLAIFAGVLNVTIVGVLAVRLRIVITRDIQARLFTDRVLYNTLVLDKNVDNYDQRVCNDLAVVCDSGLNPFISSVLLQLFNAGNGLYAASTRLPAHDPKLSTMFWAASLGVFIFSWLLLTYPMNTVSRLLFTSKRYEGDLRWNHCRVMVHAESIALFAGEGFEEEQADRAYDRVHTNMSALVFYGSLLYGLSVGLTNGLAPFINNSIIYYAEFKPSQVYVFQAILGAGIAALVAIPMSYMSLSVAGGPVHRVGTLLEAIDRNALSTPEIPHHASVISGTSQGIPRRVSDPGVGQRNRLRWPAGMPTFGARARAQSESLRWSEIRGAGLESPQISSRSEPSSRARTPLLSAQNSESQPDPSALAVAVVDNAVAQESSFHSEEDSLPPPDTFMTAESIVVTNLTTAPPSAPHIVLFQNLSIAINRGQSLAITGPSGCGKSSFLRSLAGLWEPLEGVVDAPQGRGRAGLFFMPQRPYVTTGTLFEQVVYPHAYEEDPDAPSLVEDILQVVGLGHVLSEWGLHTPMDWLRVLAQGELQVLSFARILYHRPAFGLMDEATSALDIPSEARLMGMCFDAGITAISVCHRPSAICLHQNVLAYTGAHVGTRLEPTSWKMSPVPEADRITGQAQLQEAKQNSPGQEVQKSNLASRVLPPLQEESGMGKAFFRRFKFLLRLGVPKFSSFPTLCIVVVLILNMFFGVFDFFLTKIIGQFTVDMATTGRTGQDWLILVAQSCSVFVIGFGDFSLAYAGQLFALHIRRCATYEGHRNYFGRKVPYSLNALPTKCVAGSQTHWQPDQRMQQDASAMYDAVCGSVTGSSSTKGFPGAVIELTIGMAFGFSLSWIMVCIITTWALTMMAVQYITLGLISKGNMNMLRAEGAFRMAHALVREFVESIVFYGGQTEEARRCDKILTEEVSTARYWLLVRSIPAAIVGYTLTLGASGVIVISLSRIAFFWHDQPLDANSYGTASAYFSSTGTLQLGWIASAWGGLGALAGTVHRVCGFIEASKEASDWVEDQDKGAISAADKVSVQAVDVRTPELVLPGTGQISEAQDVIKGLSFEVPHEGGLVIDGNSGSGKSSLFRIFGGLWLPGPGGKVTRPPIMDGSFFVGQSSYATEGSLLEQVAYPAKTGNADDAVQCLEMVGLEYLTEHWGMDRPSTWCEHLSGGEMQRLGLARVLYHKQRFAFLDESTCALNVALEQKCLQAVKDQNITPISVSVRPTTRQFHDELLTLKGTKEDGRWELKKCR